MVESFKNTFHKMSICSAFYCIYLETVHVFGTEFWLFSKFEELIWEAINWNKYFRALSYNLLF